MKFLVVALTLLVASHAQVTNSTEDQSVSLKKFLLKTRTILNATLPVVGAQIHDQIDKYVDRYYKNLGANYTAYENVLEIKACFGKTYDNMTLCDVITQKLPECTKKPLTESSILDELRNIPILILKTIHSVGAFACNANGKQLVELLNPCVVENWEKADSCFESASNETESKKFSTKDVFCTGTKEYKSCWEKIVNEKCKLEFTRKSVLSLLEAVTLTHCSV